MRSRSKTELVCGRLTFVLLLYVTNPHIAFPVILREFQRFSDLINFKINTYKTEALNVTLPLQMAAGLARSYPFCLATAGPLLFWH